MLVGHSYGGMVISGVAEKVPEGTIRSIVYLDAFVPQDGQSLSDMAPPEIKEKMYAEQGPIPVPFWFGGDNEELTALLKKGGTPHPRATQFEKIKLTGARERIPKKTMCWRRRPRATLKLQMDCAPTLHGTLRRSLAVI